MVAVVRDYLDHTHTHALVRVDQVQVRAAMGAAKITFTSGYMNRGA